MQVPTHFLIFGTGTRCLKYSAWYKMAKTIKQKLKKNLFILVILLTALTKVLEWTGQYLISKQVLIFDVGHSFLQIFFILTVSTILLLGFRYSKVKTKTYLLIPVLAYFIKEVYNFLFVYGRILNSVTIIALVIEPLLLYGLIQTLNKYWLKLI